MDRRNLLRATTALGATGALAGVTTTAPAAARTAAETAAASAAPAADRPFRIHLVLFDGVEEIDFAAPYEVLSAAKFFAGRPVEVHQVTVDGPRTITAAYGTKVRVVHPWAPHKADLLVVPGGGYARRDDPGVWAEIDRGVLPRALAAAVRPGLTIGALCTGVMLLSAAGITRGRPCTTHHKARPDLEAQGGLLKGARVVDDGDLVTAGGVTSGLELALWLARREFGAGVANSLEAMLEYEARGTVWTAA
ncbi:MULTISPECIES: DJ-1/PfpI family protein [unclassified Streptomyces]|uniref:DJ-1/PfpI family protein n=1 Tax=unclassified Streptomyces TaxID=2593676 RepID=UPI00166169BD|nr:MULTISPECIES: DJ-1/PfpI family protein [unclassified Streptomyces]MBD0709471.1 AraC family transcriptional regulator [Streptomyces sp. CBMA291]MBD0713181.1 AraC family transcriptional regulator [Streptomyces sp. CBMA370]